jgi:hypothetical protein
MMDDTTKQALLSATRTLLAAAGAWLATHKYIDAESANEIVGAVMILIPILWGMWDKYRAERKTKAREAVAVNVGIKVADATIGETPLVTAADAPAVIASGAPHLPASAVPEVPPPKKDPRP